MIARFIAEKCIETPDIIENAPYVWGELLKYVPDYADRLRKIFVTCAIDVNKINYWSRNVEVFTLNFPNESRLLPFLLYVILTERDEFRRNEKFESHLDRVRSAVGTMVEDIESLTQIIDQQLEEPQVCVSAILSLLLHPRSAYTLDKFKETLVAYYQSVDSLWYIRSISTVLSLLMTEENQAAMWIVGRLLDATRNRYEQRLYLQGLLTLWRENSHAPVQKANLQDKWLKGI